MENIATRAAYGEALAAMAKDYPELVVLDADLSGSTMSKKFADVCPERFFNIGIAEANMAARSLSFTPLPCLPLAVPGSRCATPSPIPG